MVYLPSQFEKILNRSQIYKGYHKLLGGGVLAIIESFVICPLERLKVSLMTEKVGIAQIIREKSLFIGINIVFAKQFISWTTFLFFEHFFKKHLKKYLNTENNALDVPILFATSILVGVTNILCVYPFDTVKTLIQMKNQPDKKIMFFFRQIFQNNGILGFY